jgi:hypothetical protein
MNEIYRVLSDGYLYFDEEPFKRVLKLVLYRQNSKMYSESTLRKSKYVRLIESFISETPCDEVEYGIVENNNISLIEWINALSIFDQHDVNLFSIMNLTSKLNPRLRLNNIPNFLLGGIIAGLCRKRVKLERNSQVEISDILGCPDCMTPSDNSSFDRPALIKFPSGFLCSQCGFNILAETVSSFYCRGPSFNNCILTFDRSGHGHMERVLCFCSDRGTSGGGFFLL